MDAEERRRRNIERYEARVRQVRRIKRTIVIVAVAVAVGVTGIVWGAGHRKNTGTATVHAENDTTAQAVTATPTATPESGNDAAVSGVSAVSDVTAGSAGMESDSSAASSSAETAAGFGEVGETVAQAASEGAEAVSTPKYIWADMTGVTDGSVPDNDPSLQEGTKKIIYLTFDDGPGPYTAQLLDILKKHNAKATFFVTNQFPEYADLIKREADEGHSIAVHTYSHDYQTIYASSENFWNDFEQMQQIIEQETGYRTKLMRFPGGSSNTVSRFNPGIMTQLIQEAESKGYTFIDWNASSGDGRVDTTSESVIAESEEQCSYSDTSVLLCHDIKQSTVEAMDEFLTWGEQNGYTFLPMSPYSNSCHQQINN